MYCGTEFEGETGAWEWLYRVPRTWTVDWFNFAGRDGYASVSYGATGWVNTWFDPGKEADAAKVLIGQGADIITQHTDSTAPMQIAGEKGARAFGQASDMIKFGPKAQLTSIINNWAPYYIERTKAVLDGSWKSVDSWKGLPAGTVKMGAYTNMPADVAKMAAETEAKITNGTLHPFTGPIYKQDGKLAVPAGKKIDDGMLLGMNWYVKGIDGQLPK